MLIKTYIKKIGRIPILLKAFSINDIAQVKKILIIWLTHSEHLRQIIASVKEKIPHSRIFILTGEVNREFIEREMPDCELILPAVNTHKFRYAWQLFRFRKEGFDCVILTKIDVSIIFVASLYFKIPVLLNNVWREWYIVRLRKISEIFMLSDDTRRRLSMGPVKKADFSLPVNFLKLCYSAIAHIYLFIKVTILVVKNLIKTSLRFKIREKL